MARGAWVLSRRHIVGRSHERELRGAVINWIWR